MIAQKKMKGWISEAVERFKSVMPSIDAEYPEIIIASDKTATRKRAAAVEKIRSPQKNSGSDSAAMEFLHGELGDAIMVYQNQWQENPYNRSKEKADFLHALWHELGHFYASHAECPEANLIQYLDQRSRDGFDSITQIGYWLWEEFIAETIACHIDPDPKIDWNEEDWHPIRYELAKLLYEAFYREEDTINEYAFGIYFAKQFSDKKTVSFLQGAENGTIYYREYRVVPSLPKTFKQAGIDPLPLEVIEDDYYPVLNELQNYLHELTGREKYWEISEDSVTQIGILLAKMIVIKKMKMNRENDNYIH